MQWKTYGMFRGKMVETGWMDTGFYGDSFSSFSQTKITFRARTETEANRKMDKFIREAGIRGSFFMREI